jgi:hypothetical protein
MFAYDLIFLVFIDFHSLKNSFHHGSKSTFLISLGIVLREHISNNIKRITLNSRLLLQKNLKKLEIVPYKSSYQHIKNTLINSENKKAVRKFIPGQLFLKCFVIFSMLQ